jgi:CheY-like chemotaxis protein
VVRIETAGSGYAGFRPSEVLIPRTSLEVEPATCVLLRAVETVSFDRAVRVVVVSWSSEAEGRASALRARGFEVEVVGPRSMADLRPVRDSPPDVLVVDLDRRPSDARAIAAKLRQYAATRRVPLVVAGGEEQALERTQRLLPDAIYAAWDDGLAAALEAARAPERPLVPGTMDDYAGTPLPRKIGVRDDTSVHLIGAPESFRAALGPTRAARPANIVMLFVRSHADLDAAFADAEHEVARGGSLWIAWPKRASGVPSDLTQPSVRAYGLTRGLVDFKVAALDEVWTGLRFARRA